MPTRLIVPEERKLDLAATLHPMVRGGGDPTARVRRGESLRAARTPDGPATLRLVSRSSGEVEAEAWGPGADWALDTAPDLIGATDRAEGFVPLHPAVEEAWRRCRGVRITRSRDVTRTLMAAILEQKVTGIEARRAWRGLVRALSEPAPGSFGLLLPPHPARVVEMPYFAMHPLGIERRRAEVLRAACGRASRIEKLCDDPPREARAWLERLPGIGPWTAAQVARIALGDPDAVSVGDFHMPHLICWSLAGEPRGTDERMLELLEPYRGHRGRVQGLLLASGAHAPRFGPRQEPAFIERY